MVYGGYTELHTEKEHLKNFDSDKVQPHDRHRCSQLESVKVCPEAMRSSSKVMSTLTVKAMLQLI